MEPHSQKVAWFSTDQIIFQLQRFAEQTNPFSYSFIFCPTEHYEASLYAETAPSAAPIFRLTVKNAETCIPLLHNELLLAVLVMSSKIAIHKNLSALRREVADIFDALGLELKWTKQDGRWYVSSLEEVLVTNLDLLSFQQAYYEKQGNINVETIAVLKQYNAYNYVKEQVENTLPDIIRQPNFEDSYDQFIEELRLTYIELSASARVKCRAKKWTFDNLELYIQKELAASAMKPVVTVFSDTPAYDQQPSSILNSPCKQEEGPAIEQIFQKQFEEIQSQIDSKKLDVPGFQESINNFVKSIASNLQSQENLLHLMEYLLNKTFTYFQTYSHIPAPADPQPQVSNKYLIKKYTTMKSKLGKQLNQVQNELFKAQHQISLASTKLQNVVSIKDEQISTLNNQIVTLKNQVTKLRNQNQMLLIEQKSRVQSYSQLEVSTSQDSLKTSIDSIPVKTFKKPSIPPLEVVEYASSLKNSVSMKELPTIDKNKYPPAFSSITPKAEATGSTAARTKLQNLQQFSRKPINQTAQNKVSKAPEPAGRKTATGKKEETTLIKNLSSMISYVQEQSKNLSQRGSVKGKENITKKV